MRLAVLACAAVCVSAAGALAAGLGLHEVPASTNAPFHLEFSNDAVSLVVFPDEGGRVEGCTNLNAVLPVASTNTPVAWRWTRAKSGARTLWLGGAGAGTNGVSRTMMLSTTDGPVSG